GTSQFSGGLSVLGSLALGNEISDIIDVKGRFSSSLVPSEDAAYSLGLPDYRWSNFYVATATIDNLIAGGSASSTFIINTDNTSADAEDSQLEFERGSAAPNAVFKWNSADDRFEFNDFSVYMANSLQVAGSETSSFAGPALFTGTPLGTGVGQGSLYINPSSGLSDYTVFSVAVNDNERFRVDAEGDTTVQGSLGIENYIYDITQDTLLVSDDLQVGGGDIKDAGGNVRITLGATNTITGNLAVSTGYITGANSEQIILGATDNKVQVVRGGSTYTICDSSGNCQSADGGYVGGLGNANYLSKFTGSYSVGDSIVYDNGSQVGIGTTTPSAKLTVEGKIFAATQGTAPGEVVTAGRILTAGTGLSGGGNLTQDRTFSVDYGSTSDTAVEGDTQVTVTAGDAITGGGTITLGEGGTVTLNHEDTSSQSSVDNSDGNVIQDVTLDTYGHITGVTSYDLDGRYYTETESDSRFVNVTGDTMSGNLTMTGTSANIILGSNYLSGDGDDEGVYVDSLGNVGIGTSTPSAKLAVSGSVMVEGDLQFMGNSAISGSGTLTLNPAGNLELQSSANYIDESGNLVVSGRVDADTLQYSGSITINATSSGATTVLVTNADGRAVADLQIEGDIDVRGGKLTLADGETISAETSDHIVISSGGTEVLDIISGGVSITGNVTTTDRLYVTSGGADVTGQVDIAGLTTITGDTSITGNVTTTGALVVQNGADITGALASDQLTVSGQTDLRGSVLNTTGNFTISDNVDMSGNLSLTGNSTSVVFSGTGDHLLSVTSGTLKLGTSTLAGDITGAGYQISDLGRLTVDNLILDGNTLNTASGDLVLDSNSGTTQISDSLIVTGLLEVQGNFASSSFAGQVELFGTPDGTAVDQGSLYVNPATAGVNNTLLGVAVSDVQKMRFDAEGDMEISGTFSSTGGGTSQFSGGLSVLGSLALGNEISDIFDVKGRFSSSLVPSEDAAYSLG
ncbi:MAG: hypothetical protein PHQ43_14100, partial [Dehalococcoidales bacterium]|nr:hypothetical protein [Dehalococcoidales bacterium]